MTRHALFGGFVLLSMAMVVWPLYPALGAAIEPRVLGLPFSFAWHIGWVVAMFAALITYHLTDPDHGA